MPQNAISLEFCPEPQGILFQMLVLSSQSPLWVLFFQVHYIILEVIESIYFNWTILNLHKFTFNLQG